MITQTKILGWMPTMAVISIVALVYVAWIVAFAQLGRWPSPSEDDPQSIGGVSAIVSAVASEIILVLLGGWIVTTLAMSVIALLPRTSERVWWWKQIGVGIVAMVLMILSAHYSPGSAVTWFLD